ncbi:unnamed protein product [Bursaphelenchus xylophilus]|uniref:(pine wood nematode) hypothetical protein n=1 Tax=Bursaphelenchus xylophilus TaxID=6326 RepID=A0A1I7S3A6_BURXY|nr:unnamed protein product [Bursaphelenchus xylophilus]CAG9116174.1 unnamed protein product [Bursaphelenchus xylophilus]
MDCAFVASSPHVYAIDVAYQQVPAGKENVHLPAFDSFEQTQLIISHPPLNSTLSSSLTSIDVQHLSPSSSSTASSSQSQCRCIIDISNPTSLERDFYAWLQGNESQLSRNTPCIFQNAPSDIDLFESLSPGTSHCSEASSSNQEISVGKQKNRRKRNVDKGRGTNLYGRPYCPGRPLSMDERYQIIQLFQAGMKVNAISKQLCISHGCVSKIITRFRDTGLLIPSSHAECRRRKRLQMEANEQMS